MKLKVCGISYPENMEQIAALNPDYLGFIFYEKSTRFACDRLRPEHLEKLSENIKKIGVFVNAESAYIKEKVELYKLDLIQLHGNESPDFCVELSLSGLKIIKAFAVDQTFDFAVLENYQNSCEFFLFDTKGKDYGGNGITFDWNILHKYDNNKPFFMSGGLDIDNIKNLSDYPHLNIHCLDINSKFEISPGFKDITKVLRLTELLNYSKNI